MVREGRVLTQKREPLLAQIQTRIDAVSLQYALQLGKLKSFIDLYDTSAQDRGVLILSCVGEGEVEVPLAGVGGEECTGSVCGEPVLGRSCGEEVGEWLERVLGVDGVKLVRGVSRRSSRRVVSTSLANDSGCLVVSLESVREVVARVEENCRRLGEEEEWGEERLASRFRANLVVSGGAAWAEEGWGGFRVGGGEWKVGEPCRRCTMITVDQVGGERGIRSSPGLR